MMLSPAKRQRQQIVEFNGETQPTTTGGDDYPPSISSRTAILAAEGTAAVGNGSSTPTNLAPTTHIPEDWYRPTDAHAPFVLAPFSSAPSLIEETHLSTISSHYLRQFTGEAERNEELIQFKAHFIVRYMSQCAKQQRFWRAWPLFFRDFSLPKLPDMASGTVGCWEKDLYDPKSLVGVARAVWEFVQPIVPHGVHIELCPPSILSDAWTFQNGTFYAYLTAEGDVISPNDPVAYIIVKTF
jgi:hypothetical protein